MGKLKVHSSSSDYKTMGSYRVDLRSQNESKQT